MKARESLFRGAVIFCAAVALLAGCPGMLPDGDGEDDGDGDESETVTSDLTRMSHK